MVWSKIMGYKQKRIFFIFTGVALHLFLALIGTFFSISIFIFAHSLFQIFQVVISRIIWKKSKLFSIFGFYLLMYSVISILTILIENVFLLSKCHSQIVELVLHFLFFGLCFVCCINEKVRINIVLLIKTLPLNTKVLLLSFIVANTWFLSLILSTSVMQESLYFNVLLRITIVLLSILLFIIFPIIIITILSNSYLKTQNDIFKKDIEAQAQHYRDLAKANYELRRFRHDFNNIKIGLEKALNDNDCRAALSIIENNNYDIQNAAYTILEFDTGNGIVDAILSDKQIKANKSNAKIVFAGSVPPASIAPDNLCVLFGNTIDNAIEACERIPGTTEKIISVSCKCSNGFAFISITNPVVEDVKVRGNNIETTKEDKTSHGYGLYSLNKIIKNLDGSLNLSCADRIFKVEIDISIEQLAIYA